MKLDFFAKERVMTNEQWQQLVEEFGDHAFERIDGVNCNDDVDYYLSVGDDLQMKYPQN